MTPEQWPTFGTIDGHGAFNSVPPEHVTHASGGACSFCAHQFSNLPSDYPQAKRWLNPTLVVGMAEERPFDITIIVEGAGQPDMVVHREYRSRDAASTDGAAREILDGFMPGTAARLKPVNDRD